MIGCTFAEEMQGTLTDASAEGRRRVLRFVLDAAVPRTLDFLDTATASVCGRLWWDGLADGVATRGSIVVAAAHRRRLEYRLDFEAPDGAAYRFEGEKHISLRHLARSWTTLHSRVVDAGDGRVLATGVVTFDLRRDLLRFLLAARLRRSVSARPTPQAH